MKLETGITLGLGLSLSTESARGDDNFEAITGRMHQRPRAIEGVMDGGRGGRGRERNCDF